MSEEIARSSPSLSEMPRDTLHAYARELGLSPKIDAPQGELLREIRQRQELLLDIEHEALLDIAAWARVPVRRSASKEQLAREISRIEKYHYDDLSERGLRALARLRGVELRPTQPRPGIVKALRRHQGLVGMLRQKRREVVAELLERVLVGPREDVDYQFLPENDADPSLKERIQDAGVVGGIARKLRGLADDYVAEKLDEIEHRIDQKLDEIDTRLAEWRDREIKNRLRILRITIVAAIIVAVVSLGYDYIRAWSLGAYDRHPQQPPAGQVEQAQPGD